MSIEIIINHLFLIYKVLQSFRIRSKIIPSRTVNFRHEDFKSAAFKRKVYLVQAVVMIRR